MKLIHFGRRPNARPVREPTEPDWKQANPRWIERSLQAASARPSGGWFVLDASRRIDVRPRCFNVDDVRVVAWRDGNGRLRVAPNECPHMGASLADGHVDGTGRIVCPWHGLAVGDTPRGTWRPHASHDDGVLSWLRLDHTVPESELTETPILPERPRTHLDGVIRMEARCEPRDVIQNRLDPWHGVHFHPYAFGRLRVLAQREDDIVVRVSYRVIGPLAVEVDARFHSPEPRTIVMTIIDGDGAGSVVETHATPMSPGRTAIIEATLATTDRPGFGLALAGSRWIRPFIERAAGRLWVDDAAYAERLYELRQSEGSSARRSAKLRPVETGPSRLTDRGGVSRRRS